MDKVAGRFPLTFNGPLEAGVRAVAILAAAFPRSYDMARLTALDYLLTHTHQLGGPDDLHPEAPIQMPATEVRRSIVQNAIHLMMTRDLISRCVDAEGIVYRAGEAAVPFVNAFQSRYLLTLNERAKWLVSEVGDYTNAQFAELMKRFFDEWVMEFQAVQSSLGAEQ